jgi:hypothetical protein
VKNRCPNLMTGTRRAVTLGASVLLPGLAAAMSGCASAPEPLSAQELEGCFYFDREQTGDGSMRLPWGVRLLPDSLEGWPIARRGDVRVAATLTADGDTDYPFSYWLPSEDSVMIGSAAGGGVLLELEVGEAALQGTALSLGDARGLDAREPEPVAVRLIRARCPED